MIDGGIPKGSQGRRSGAIRTPGSIASRPDQPTGSKCPVCMRAHGGHHAYIIPAACNSAVMAVWKARVTDSQGLEALWQRFPGLEGKNWEAIKELLMARGC